LRSEVVQAVGRFLSPTPLRNPHPTDVAKVVSWRRKGYFGGSPGGP